VRSAPGIAVERPWSQGTAAASRQGSLPQEALARSPNPLKPVLSTARSPRKPSLDHPFGGSIFDRGLYREDGPADSEGRSDPASTIQDTRCNCPGCDTPAQRGATSLVATVCECFRLTDERRHRRLAVCPRSLRIPLRRPPFGGSHDTADGMTFPGERNDSAGRTVT
jgi:hypothetical protein